MTTFSSIQVLLPLVLLALVNARAQESACDLVPVKEALGTDKYLLYGLTTDCRLFFATKIPEGVDIGRNFDESTEQFDCSNTLLRPIRDSKGRLRLMIVFKVGDVVYEKVRDFPAFKDGEWYDVGDRIYECPVNSAEKCKAKGQYLRKLKNSPTQKVLGFVDHTGSEFDLLDPIYFYNESYYQYPIKIHGFNMMPDGKLTFVKANLTQNQWKMSFYEQESMNDRVIIKRLLTDSYKDYIYFTTSTVLYRTSLSKVKTINILEQTLAPLQEWSVDIGDNNDFNELSFSVVDNKKIGLKYSTPSKTSANIEIQRIYSITDNNRGLSSGLCIGHLRSHSQPVNNDSPLFNSLTNFQMSALLFDDYNAVMHRKPSSE